MQVIELTNKIPNTPFAPTWSCILLEYDNLLIDQDILLFKSFILDYEHQIIDSSENDYNTYNNNYDIVFDGGTGLGPNSLTSRSPFYNLLKVDIPVIQQIKSNIHDIYLKYLELLNIPRREVWIQSWANIMRNGEIMSEHIHASHENTWIGGHITISCENTSTFYKAPVRLTDDQIYESQNKPGKLTLFPDCVPHWTSTHTGEQERISIAFDIITRERFTELTPDRQQMYMKFDNE